jgi:hypothetical protein
MSNQQLTPFVAGAGSGAISPRVRVSGHVYDVVTGLVETVIAAGR